MDVLTARIDRLYLGSWILLMEDVLGLKLLVAASGIVNALTLICKHVLIVFDLCNLLIL